jgi:hypothetical protein
MDHPEELLKLDENVWKRFPMLESKERSGIPLPVI